MRLDRLITLNLVQPWRRALGLTSDLRSPTSVLSPLSSVCPLPILMYHSISDEPEPGVAAYYKTNTSPAVFAQHMQFLADHGYRTITLSQAVEWLGASALVPAFSRNNHIAGRDASAPWRVGPQPSTLNSQLVQHPSPISHLPSSAKLVSLTFDDGYRNFYTEAFPVLQKHGFTATMFLPTAFIGSGASSPSPFPLTRNHNHDLTHKLAEVRVQSSEFRVQKSELTPDLRPLAAALSGYPTSDLRPLTSAPCRHTFKGTDCLTWPEVCELRKHGIEFGSHTVTHPPLVELTWKEIKSELSNSKSAIEQQLEEPVTAFCYPYAFPQASAPFVKRFLQMLSDSGYESCVTTEIGRAKSGSDLHRLPRLPVNSADDPVLFQAKLNGHYDWLAGPQALIKKLAMHGRCLGAESVTRKSATAAATAAKPDSKL